MESAAKGCGRPVKTRVRALSSNALALLAIVLVTVASGIVTFGVWDSQRREVVAAYETRNDLNLLLTNVLDEETGLRGYVTTQEPLFLEPYELGRAAYAERFNRVADSPVLKANADLRLDVREIDRYYQKWHREIAQPLLRPNLSDEEQRRLLLRGKLYMDAIRAKIAAMQSSVRGEIARTATRTRTALVTGDAVVVFFVLLLGGFAVFSDYRYAREQARLNRELNERNAALERSNAALAEFAYVASHDLQEPLRTVASFSQLLQRRYADKLDATANEFINFAVDGAQRMQQLIADILQYSRVNTHGKPLEPVDLGACVRGALANLHAAIRERHAVVDIGEMPEVLGDPVQLTQLLQNLIGNALKYSTATPRIAVEATPGAQTWTIAVRDNGIGISAEYHERIFRIFQRLHTRTEYSGTGIGLAIAKGIVDRHGGRIWVESQEGSGSTFYFTLRRADNEEGEAA